MGAGRRMPGDGSRGEEPRGEAAQAGLGGGLGRGLAWGGILRELGESTNGNLDEVAPTRAGGRSGKQALQGAGRVGERGGTGNELQPADFSGLTFPGISPLATIGVRRNPARGRSLYRNRTSRVGFVGRNPWRWGGVGSCWKQPAEHRPRAALEVSAGHHPGRLGGGAGGAAKPFCGPCRSAVATPWRAAPERHCPVCPREVGRERSGLVRA